MVNTEHMAQSRQPCYIKPNHLSFNVTISEMDPNGEVQIVTDWSNANIMLEQPCRVRYKSPEFGRTVILTGRLPNGKKYPVWIDSGMVTWPILVNDCIAKENKLDILCRDSNPYSELSYLPSLEIGNLTIQNLACLYIPRHWELQVFGLPIWQDKRVVFGIEAMARFRYILFDNVKKELEFSYKQPFCPIEFEKWVYYPFTLKNMGYPDGRRLIVNIPIAGETYHIEFDTGGRDIVISPDMWENLRKRVNTTGLKQNKFVSYKYGILPCHTVVADEIAIGNIMIKNAEIEILPEDSPYLLKKDLGQIGIRCFRDTEVVLDFERNLMWVKNKGDKPISPRSIAMQ